VRGWPLIAINKYTVPLRFSSQHPPPTTLLALEMQRSLRDTPTYIGRIRGSIGLPQDLAGRHGAPTASAIAAPPARATFPAAITRD
jgi:hypothetical protein